MINLIGTDLNYDWLKLPLVHLHWYDKEVRAGRKVGHLNLNDSDTDRLSATGGDRSSPAARIRERNCLGTVKAQVRHLRRGVDLPRRTIPPIAAEFSSGITMNDGTDYRAILASDTL